MTRSVYNQDEIADLFCQGIDNKRSPKGNLYSENGVLTHYSTIEAIRSSDEKYIIENSECWSSGFAKCPRFPRYENKEKIFINLPLTYIQESNSIYSKYELRDKLKIEKIIIKPIQKIEIDSNSWIYQDHFKNCDTFTKENRQICKLSYYQDIDYYFEISINGKNKTIFKNGQKMINGKTGRMIIQK